jgi:catechol 2,3-dioxygenase-like lactoylglutathione lyase family enzyme/GNAT superfamily N-acetyltransferase
MAHVQPMASPSGSAAGSCRVRRARDANVAEINQVIVASKSHWDSPESYLQAALPLLMIDESYLAEHLCFEIVDESSNVVCFFAVAEDSGEHVLDHLWVRPDRLGLGIGRLACEHVFSLARRYRWPVLLVLPEPRAHGFYRKMGFEDTDMRVNSRVRNGPSFSVLRKHFDDTDDGRVAGLSHVTFTVRDLDKACDFYTRVLGFGPLSIRRKKSANLRSRTFWLALVEDENKTNDPSDCSHLALFATRANFDALEKRLAEEGAELWQQNASPGRSVYFLDPSGNKLEIHEQTWRDRLGWLACHPSEALDIFT